MCEILPPDPNLSASERILKKYNNEEMKKYKTIGRYQKSTGFTHNYSFQTNSGAKKKKPLGREIVRSSYFPLAYDR